MDTLAVIGGVVGGGGGVVGGGGGDDDSSLFRRPTSITFNGDSKGAITSKIKHAKQVLQDLHMHNCCSPH